MNVIVKLFPVGEQTETEAHAVAKREMNRVIEV
jgi:hypothetical protein